MKVRIALLPAAEQSAKLIDYSQALAVAGDGYRLDGDHLPHITILAWEVDDLAEAESVWHLLDDVLLPEVHCKVEGLDCTNEGPNAGYILAHIEGSDELKAFMKTVHEAVREKVGEADRAKYADRTPHLTIGVDVGGVSTLAPAPLEVIEFDRVALVESGAYGAATNILFEQSLA